MPSNQVPQAAVSHAMRQVADTRPDRAHSARWWYQEAAKICGVTDESDQYRHVPQTWKRFQGQARKALNALVDEGVLYKSDQHNGDVFTHIAVWEAHRQKRVAEREARERARADREVLMTSALNRLDALGIDSKGGGVDIDLASLATLLYLAEAGKQHLDECE